MARAKKPVPSAAAALVLRLRISDRDKHERFRGTLAGVRLEGGGRRTPPLAGARPIDLDLGRRAEQTLELGAPPGRYDRLVLDFDRVELTPRGKAPARFELALDLKVDARSGLLTRIELVMSAAALAKGNPGKAFEVSATLVGASARTVVDARRTQTLSLDGSDATGVRRVGGQLTVRPGALPDGTRIDIVRGAADELPALFPRQKRMGDIIRVDASAAARLPLEVTVPYDAGAVAAAGLSARELVVLRLDDARTAYQELRPSRVDTAERTLTVRTSRLSSFFASTGGILVEVPPPFLNVAGDTLFYVPEGTATVSGTVAAPEAVVTLNGLNVANGWNRAGRFGFEGVELLPRIESRVSLRATVEGLLAHTCDITLRRLTPPKRIGTVHRFGGPTLKFLDIGTPVVSTGIVRVGRGTDAGLLPRLGSWQRGRTRHAGVLHEYDSVDETWRAMTVVPESHFENEAARVALEGLNALLPPVPIDGALPEGERFLRALEAFLEARGEAEATGPLRDLLDLGMRLVGTGSHALSCTLPFVQMNDGLYGVAYVAATWPGDRAAGGNALQPYLDRVYGQQFEPLPARQIPAGRLFFRRVSRAASEDPELVLDDLVWCTSLAMQLDPLTGQPVILALGLRPAEAVAGQAPGGGAILLLCQRRSNGTWVHQEIGGSNPYVSADFAFAPDGSIRIVAAQLDVSGFADGLNARMVLLAPAGALYIAEPITWLEGPYDVLRNRGIWPRITFDPRGRLVVAFCYDVKAVAAPIDPEVPFKPPTRPFPIDAGVQWWIGVSEEGVDWRMNRVDFAEYADLTGADDGNRPTDLALGISAQTRAGFDHWAPSIAADPLGTVWMAYGKGALHLREIELDTLTSTDRTVDVDRVTGFYPSLALRDAGVPAIAYKDLFGRGERRPAREVTDLTTEHFDDLHYFRFDEGNFVPRNPAEPLAPGHAIDVVDLRGFGPRVPLTCPNITQFFLDALALLLFAPDRAAAVANPLVASLLMHATIDWGLMPGHASEGLVRDLRIGRSHPALARHLESLFPRPDIIEFFIRNDRDDEDIARIDLTVFSDLFAIDDADGSLREELRLRSMGQVPHDPPEEDDDADPPEGDDGERPRRRRPLRRATPIRLRNHFARAGFRLSPDVNIHVQEPDRSRSFWLLTDDAAFPGVSGAAPQGYEVFVDGNRITARLPPRLTITDRNDRSANVCGQPQAVWDQVGAFLADRLGSIVPELPDEAKTAKLVAAAGITFRLESLDPERPQQGSVRFTATVPHFVVWGDEPGTYVLRTTTPSKMGFTLAPFVEQGGLRWFPREVFGSVGELDLTIDGSSVPLWVSLVFLITGPLLLGGLAIAEDIMEDRARENTSGFTKVGGLIGLLQPIYTEWARTRFPNGQPPALDAVLLRDQLLFCWTREDAFTAQANFQATPDRLTLVAAVGTSVRRNLLLQNAGPVPVFLEDVALQHAGGEFRIAPPVLWPEVLEPGQAEIVRIEFTPDLPVGQRENRLDVRFNGGSVLTAALFGLAQTPRSLVVRPADGLRFGVVTVGTSRTMRVELANQGQGPLTVGAVQVNADAASQGRFTVAQRAPLVVPALQSGTLDVTFTPNAMVTGGNQGTLAIDSDDPDHPHVELHLVGFGAAANLLVVPAAVSFPNTPVGGAMPEVRRAVSVYNTGLVTVTITGSSFRIVDPVGAPLPDFQLLDNGGVPVAIHDTSIPSSGQLVLQVRFRPTAAAEYHGVLRLHSSTAGQADVVVLLDGRGV